MEVFWLLSGTWTLLGPFCSWNSSTVSSKNNLRNKESCWEMTPDWHTRCAVPSAMCSRVFLHSPFAVAVFIVAKQLFNQALSADIHVQLKCATLNSWPA